jgi:hypothetical protein
VRRAGRAASLTLAGLSWHHARHAYVCIERGHWWQAEHWISGIRDHAITLACLQPMLAELRGPGTGPRNTGR